MCDELETAIETQEQVGTDATKGALALTKAALKSMKKQGNAMKEMAEKFNKHVEESDKRLASMSADIKYIKETVNTFYADATKWQLIIQICKALFGDTKRCILTTVWGALILGAVHFSEIIELLKAMV